MQRLSEVTNIEVSPEPYQSMGFKSHTRIQAIDHIKTVLDMQFLPRYHQDSASTSLESSWAAGNEGGAGLNDAVWEREPELRLHKLFNVGPANVLALLDLDHTEDLRSYENIDGMNSKERT
jgi:hypothetical protein